jgi:hypothetical protein
MRSASTLARLSIVVLAIGGCAGSSSKREGPAFGPKVAPIVLPTATTASASADAAPPLDPHEVSDALARAYAKGDEGAIRSIARQLFVEPSPRATDAGAPVDPTTEHWSSPRDDLRFAVGTPTGLYLGSGKDVHIEAFLPELGNVVFDPVFLPDPNLVAIQKPLPVGSDGCRMPWPEEDQEELGIVDFNTHEVVLRRRGRIVGASPDRTTLLLSDGSESKLTLYDIHTGSERAVSFDVVNLRGNPLPWKATNCSASCEDERCVEGAPSPWNLRRHDVAFSPDGSYVALNWNGVSRGVQQAVSVHETRTGAMVVSFVSQRSATVLFSSKGNSLGLLLTSPKARPPYFVEDTLLVFDGDRREIRRPTGCAFASDRQLDLGISSNGTRLVVRWDLSGGARDSEGCEFDLATSRFLGKIHPGDPRHDDFRFKDPAFGDGNPSHDSSPWFAPRRASYVCSQGGYLFPKGACPEPPAAP